MFIQHTQQVRNLFVKLSVEAGQSLTASEFIVAASKVGVLLSPMTAMMVSGDITALEVQEATQETQEAVFA